MLSTISLILLLAGAQADVQTSTAETNAEPVETAQTSDAVPEAPKMKAKQKPEKPKAGSMKKVCKKFPPKAGSRLRARKVCMTQGEWDAEKRDRDRQLDRVQGRWGYEE